MQLNFIKKLTDLKSKDILVTALNEHNIKNISQEAKKNPIFKFVADSFGVALEKLIRKSTFKGHWGQSISFDLINKGDKPIKIYILGFNDKNDTFDKEGSKFEQCNHYRKIGANLYRIAKREKLSEINLTSSIFDWAVPEYQEALIEGAILASYSFNKYKSKKKEEDPEIKLKNINIYSQKFKKSKNLSRAIDGCKGTFLARDLINTPALDCTPAYLVSTARKIAKSQRLKITVFNRKALTKMKAGGILSVSMASATEPYLIKLSYKPKAKSKRSIALVGKGITFDSGGLSIKPGQGMETMKCDMSGAAAVLGVMSAIRSIAPKVEVNAYIPTCENMIANNALRPGDVIKIMNGKSVEVLNTDAEGRLILADALTLAVRDKNETIVDLATLTGACVVALGNDYAGLFTNSNELSEELIKSSTIAGERVWRMPLAKEYNQQLKSNIADLKNIGSRNGGGAITAALFLQHFVNKKTKWAHIDIAGPAFKECDSDLSKAGGTGFGVRSILRFLS